MIRILLLARGHPDDEPALLEYQRLHLGALSGDVCLTELSPLPTRSHGTWPYATHDELPQYMRSREQFMQRTLPGRIATLREKLMTHSPRAVVFYFWNHREHAEAVAGGEFSLLIPEKLLGLKRNGTTYFIIGHPAGRYPDTYFSELGHYFHANHRELFAEGKVSFLQKAIAIAVSSPYILHPLRMMLRLETEAEQIVAILHDVVEDTHWTFDELKREGFPDDILEALDCVTKRAGESYEAFVARSASNPLARRVKLADLEDNMNLRELPELTPKDAERMAKYLKAWQHLRGKR